MPCAAVAPPPLRLDTQPLALPSAPPLLPALPLPPLVLLADVCTTTCRCLVSSPAAAEPRNMGYMVRLGLWGEGSPAFANFSQFLEVVQVRPVSSCSMCCMS